MEKMESIGASNLNSTKIRDNNIFNTM